MGSVSTVRKIDRAYIGGTRRPVTGEVRTLLAPATEMAHATLTCAAPADADAAVAAACAAAPGWQGLESAQRAAFVAAMGELAALRGPVDAFFEQVLVNSPVPEERDNRLRLLTQVRQAMDRVADFSRVTG